MKITGKNALKVLQENASRFDPESCRLKNECLETLSKSPLPALSRLAGYHDLLLFLLAHPHNSQTVTQTEKELARISSQLSKHKNNPSSQLESSGLPFTHVVTSFSHDILAWILQQKELRVDINSMTENADELNDLLKLTLPSLERDQTSFGYDANELFENLQVNTNQKLPFLIAELSTYHNHPVLKDYLFEKLALELKLWSHKSSFSRSYNRFSLRPFFYHSEILKKFDHRSLFDTALPEATNLTGTQREQLVKTIRCSLLLMARETDPATYLDESSLRYFELERGIAIAIYGMTETRQLPLESYVGYTLFKNGFPSAYGGAWVFGKRALFGMNIFESFRGGESGYLMCQLLRTYRQVFSISNFEVEPYQFGKNNPDGIRSGAFWFYYRFGFRPMEPALKKLAESEQKKIAAKKEYRSPYNTMERFTESYINLELEPLQQASVADFSVYISAMMAGKFKSNRALAIEHCLQKFNLPKTNATVEFALVANALKITDQNTIDLIRELAAAKAKDLYYYQQLLLRLLRHPAFKALT